MNTLKYKLFLRYRNFNVMEPIKGNNLHSSAMQKIQSNRIEYFDLKNIKFPCIFMFTVMLSAYIFLF